MLLRDEVTPLAIASLLEPMVWCAESTVVSPESSKGLKDVRDRLGKPGASNRAADIAQEMLAKSQTAA